MKARRMARCAMPLHAILEASITGAPRAPGLRNVAKTPPYFPDGSVPTLPEAVKVISRVQLGVTVDEAETHDIVAFLETLAGELPANFATIATRPSGSVIEAQ
jgi:cytochrome c peroxidase